VTSEIRRARAKYAFVRGDGTVRAEGEAEVVVGDSELTVGPLVVSYLDADALHAADYRVTLELWPEGTLVLTQMGRRHDALARELRRARNQARVAGLLAHGVAMPAVFEGAWLEQGDEPRATEIEIYDTHVTLVPEESDPFQVPFGAVTRVRVADDPHGLVLETGAGGLTLGHLGRRRDSCRDAITERIDAHSRTLRSITGQDGFADGLGLPGTSVRDFTGLVARSTAANRAACAEALVRAASADPRLGFVQLLDPDGEALAAPTPLPEPWAAFLLAPVGDLTALEVIAGPAAATYVFRGPLEEVNRDLQLLHFRRAPLALTEAEADLTHTNPHRLALRRLDPLRRLRARTVARIVHNDSWGEALRRVLA
jgi:hypothetical protein